ncbi:hypothetical protein M2138_001806 [Dysgonomonadaceae bacterium PH5-43]|nr:hypothetical protein [Dysgonomonadaceae bacterium PH5-43]
MKKIIYTILIAFVSCIGVQAQTVISAAQNDSIFIELDGYKQGAINWYRSSNLSSWINISNQKDKEKFSYKLTTPLYFRARIADGTCEPIYSDTIQANISQSFKVFGGHGYCEIAPFVASSGIAMYENGALNSWGYTNMKAVWFIYQKPGTYNVKGAMKGTTGAKYNFKMNVSPSYSGLDFETTDFPIAYTATANATDTVDLFTVKINKTGYYRYEMSVTEGNVYNFSLYSFLFNTSRAPGESPAANTTKYLSSPSVHLSFSTTENTTKTYDWLYEEIVVPEGYDPTASYYMSLGFYAGYMGIQTNSDTERRVLFSVWDIVDTDKWPNAPKEALVSLVDKAEYTQANGFGNEGTGGQSYVGKGDVNTWKTGKPVKFLMNNRRVEGIISPETIKDVANKGDSIKHSIISAWYDAGEGWRYIASWRTPRKPNDKVTFDGFYSFLENYGFRNGQIPRKAYYYNAYAKELGIDGEWKHLNKVSYSNTDGAEGQRIDFEQGVAPEDPTKFYMLSGGYGKTVKQAKNTVDYVPVQNFETLKNLDLTPFAERVTQALETEALRNNLTFIDKSEWKVTAKSSEETTGESSGANGLAKYIIDGNDDTYWHSQWQGATAQFPHWFEIDMAEERDIRGFKFLSSVGESRYPKNTIIKMKANTGDAWTTVWEGTMPLSPELLILDTPVTGYRYMRLEITNGYSGGTFTRLNEIYAF